VNRNVAEDFNPPPSFSSIMKRKKRTRKLKFMTRKVMRITQKIAGKKNKKKKNSFIHA
jgi:hypothetical protein